MHLLRRWSVRHARALERLYGLFDRVAPWLRRGVSLLGADRAERWLLPLERFMKRLFFDCQMCGRCTLSATGMACPMNCPKQLRNGPCGGVAADGGCELQPDMRCVWLEAIDGAKRMSAGQAIARIQPPLDRRLRGSSAWMKTILGKNPPLLDSAEAPAAPAREPDKLERACRSGRFVVTAELSPPDSADPQDVLRRAAIFRGLVDAINVTDAAGAHCHMSSIAASALLAFHGYTPVFQIACRDRNRIAIQGDILGAAALGARNLLCVTGDGVGNGDHPDALPVFDLDAVSLLGIARRLRDEGSYASGRRVTHRPDLFLGATVNPFAPPYEERLANLEKKVAAGAQFVQTQYCFDVELMRNFLRAARERGLDRRCALLAGVGPILSARTARWMAAHVPGVRIPESIIRRLEQARDPGREGVLICVETIRALRDLPGVAGIHLMAHRHEHLVPEILAESGLARVPAAAEA